MAILKNGNFLAEIFLKVCGIEPLEIFLKIPWRVLQEVWLKKSGLVPPRVMACQHDEVTEPTKAV